MPCWDPKVRIEEMDRDGVDLQVMCATPVLFAYAPPGGAGARSARSMFNDPALEICARTGRGRLKALCQVPLQDTDAGVPGSCRGR